MQVEEYFRPAAYLPLPARDGRSNVALVLVAEEALKFGLCRAQVQCFAHRLESHAALSCALHVSQERLGKRSVALCERDKIHLLAIECLLHLDQARADTSKGMAFRFVIIIHAPRITPQLAPAQEPLN